MADPVWLLLMFDMPVKTAEQRRLANRYRHLLLDYGFAQVQLSVYSKYLVNASGVRALLPRLRAGIPPDGAVRIVRLTDEQWASTYRYHGQAEIPNARKPDQLALFRNEN